jgi:outer membrane protein assembly factor BamB
MKKYVALVAVVGLAVAVVAQAQPTLLTYPALPTRDALDRMNLRLAWRTVIPVESRRDGIATVQNFGDTVVVQTRRGAVSALDPITGAVRWHVDVGDPYPVTHDVGANDSIFLVNNGTRVYALDRAKGTQLWEVNLPSTPSSPAAADDYALYVHLAIGRVAAYAFPTASHPGLTTGTGGGTAKAGPAKAPAPVDPMRSAPAHGSSSGGRTVRFSGAISNARSTTVSGQVVATGTTGGRTATSGSEINKQVRGATVADAPELLWFYQTNLRVRERPIVGERTLLVVSTDRSAVFLDKLTGVNPTTFQADSPFTSPPGKYGETAYIGSRDGGVYALVMPARVMLWNYTADSIVITAAVTTDEDVFVAADRGGLLRLNRSNGRMVWQNRNAQRFLAANPKFIYAFDPQGRLLILDRARGTTLTQLETRELVVPVVNEVTDRLFMAANDGTVVCLHDKQYVQPVRMQAPPPPVPPPTDAAKDTDR